MPVSKRLRFHVLERDGFACYYCKRTDKPLEVDHFTPKSLGGMDIPANLRAACMDCNRGKGAYPLSEDAIRALSQHERREHMKALRPIKRAQLNAPVVKVPEKSRIERRDEIQSELQRLIGNPYLSAKQLAHMHCLIDEVEQINRETRRRPQVSPIPLELQKHVRNISGLIGRGRTLATAAAEVMQKTGDTEGVRQACELLLERQVGNGRSHQKC